MTITYRHLRAALIGLTLLAGTGLLAQTVVIQPSGVIAPVAVIPASAMNGAGAIVGKITSYNGVTTTGWGVPAIQAFGRATAQTAAVASVATYTVGAADGSFEVSANVLATVSTSYSFDVTVAWTDESNTARTLKMQLITQGGNVISNGAALTNATGPGFNGLPMHIRCKAATAITIATSGTFTTVTYNVEGTIKQVG